MRLSLRVQPRASRNEIRRSADGRWQVRITAPPVEGQANTAVSAFLAEVLGVRKSAVEVVGGKASREKVIEVTGLDAGAVEDRLQRYLSNQP